MRVIKFRAWDSEDKVMRHNAEQAYNGHWQMNDVTHYGQLLRDKSDKYKLMQYTGRKDKNGKEIYEGDICKMVILGIEDKYNPLKAMLKVIEWKHSAWGFRPLHPELVHEDDRGWSPFVRDYEEEWDTNYFEVIGNIYENADLLP